MLANVDAWERIVPRDYLGKLRVFLVSLAPPVTRLVIDYYVHKSAGVLNLGS